MGFFKGSNKTDEHREDKKRSKPGNRLLMIENKLRMPGKEIWQGDGLNVCRVLRRAIVINTGCCVYVMNH